MSARLLRLCTALCVMRGSPLGGLGCGASLLATARHQRGPTVRAELGGGAYVLSTAWADPHELSPALFTEVGSLGIVNPTARTAHAASLLLRALRGKETPAPAQAGGNLLLRARGPLHPIRILRTSIYSRE